MPTKVATNETARLSMGFASNLLDSKKEHHRRCIKVYRNNKKKKNATMQKRDEGEEMDDASSIGLWNEMDEV